MCWLKKLRKSQCRMGRKIDLFPFPRPPHLLHPTALLVLHLLCLPSKATNPYRSEAAEVEKKAAEGKEEEEKV